MPKRRAGTNKVAVRSELFFRVPVRDGTVRTMIIRDRLAVEDPYLKLMRAHLFEIHTGDSYGTSETSRQIKDDLIKVNIQI